MYISILQYLPVLASMEAPTIWSLNSWDDPDLTIMVTNKIVSHSRKLKKLRRRHQDRFLCHANSLKRIVLEDCVKVNGLSPSNGLRQHPDLEVFRMSEHVECRFGVHLGQIWREREWAVVKLQELQLVFAMGPSRREPDPSTLVDDLNPSKTSTPLLDSLYHRIAYLRQLRILDLRISMAGKVDPGSDENYIRCKEKTVPGLLVLEDQVAHRRGWLQLFSRLDQLEELHGSFNVDKVQHGFEFGEREADWIVEHWPKLKFIELYTVREGRVVEYSPGVRYLMERMPKLKVVKTFKGRYLPGYPKEAIPSTSQQANGTE
ncbi:hypothetical protein BGZ91_007913 [Linnemannia elongata]|nr:hypothetical protein BGZ91_007913 [Linnemannia elongata]